MKHLFFLVIALLYMSIPLSAQRSNNDVPNPVRSVFMQGNNINTVFRTDGIFNYDKVTYTSSIAGLIWPVQSASRLSIDYATGLWIAAKVGPQHELRNACAEYNSIFSPGNIPVLGQVPPTSVCNDTTWRGYLVNLKDPSLVYGGVRTKTAGGHTYTIQYDSWAIWPVDRGAPYVEVNGIPGYQPGWDADRPGIGNSTARPDELCFMVYMDYTNCTNNIHAHEIALPCTTLPMGLEIQQLSFMFNCYPLQDMYFIKWKFINKSSLVWDSTYITLANDPDLGDASDDAGGCDTTRDLAFILNSDNYDNEYGANPPALGTRFLQGPLRYTGNPNDTAILPYASLIGYKIVGMTSFVRIFNLNSQCFGDPDNAVSAYNFMRGTNGCGAPYFNWSTHQYTKFMYSGDACHRTGWFDSLSSEERYYQSTGPITMNSGDTQTIVMSFVIGSGSNNFQNVCNVQTLSDSAKKYYYNDFNVCFPIGIQNISSEVPKSFALYQNYPNPFNPNTKIKFSLPNPSKGGALETRLVVYDALGRVVATLVDQQMQPGSYEVEWDAGNYPSGVYFYKLESGSFSESKKLVLIK